MRLFGKLPRRCKLVRPFPVFGSRDIDGTYVVTDKPYNISFGVAPTKGEALAEYKYYLAGAYLLDKKLCAGPGSVATPEWQYIQQFITRY